jgi:hypothetical protein
MVNNINLSNLSLIKNIDEYIDKLMNGKHIYNHLVVKNDRKNIILIDEIESIIYPIEKKFIIMLLKKNEILWKCPIIFIANNKHNKFISTIKANSKIIYFDQPTISDMKQLLLNVCLKEKLYLENEEVADAIISHSQKDYRRLLFIIQDVMTNYGNNISHEYIQEYCYLSKKKDTDIDIYKAVSSMIGDYKSIDECIRYYEGEKVIIPLLLHQNYTKYLCKYSKNDDMYDLVSDISLSFAKGDIIENYIYGEQIWDMQEIHGFYTCVVPSYKLHNEKLGVSEDIIKQILDFPYDFNRTSIKNINKKNINNSKLKLTNFEIKDFICLNNFVKKMIEDEKIKECAAYFSPYKVTIESIESILKIDKMFDSKTIMQTHIKKQFVQYLGSNKTKIKN